MNCVDPNQENNVGLRTMQVDSGDCQGEPNVGDFAWLDEHGFDEAIDEKFNNVDTSRCGIDRGMEIDTGGAPPTDWIPPPGL